MRKMRGVFCLATLTTALLTVGCGDDSEPANPGKATPKDIVGTVVHVSAAADAKAADGTEVHPYATVAEAMAAIEADEQWTGTLAIHEGVYQILDDVTLPVGVLLNVDAGVTMKFAKLKAINAQANVKMAGTEEKPILLTAMTPGSVNEAWGAVTNYNPEAQDSVYDHVIFEYGLNTNFKEILERGVLTFRDAKALMTHCIFRNNFGDDALTLVKSDSIVDHCQFLNNASDAIDQGTGHAEIRFSYAEGNGNDSWDLGDGSTAWVHHNVSYKGGDKCVSIGEASGAAIIEYNLCVENAIGIGIKDESTPIVRFNTLYKNQTGVWVYPSASGYGSGKGTFANNIVWGSITADLDLSADAGTAFSYNCVQNLTTPLGKVVAGAGMLSQAEGCVDPGFADPDNPDPNLRDFHLKSVTGRYVGQTGLNLMTRPIVAPTWVSDPVSSPCLDKADPATDPAVVAFEPLPNGGLANLGCYGGTEQASKSP